MKKYTKYIILPESRLLLECCKGQVLLVDLFKMKINELSDKLYNPDYNIIVDFRDFDSYQNSTNIESISKLTHHLKQLGIKNKIALLTAKPNQVIAGEIFKKLSIELLTIKFDIFSTLEAAIKFVDRSTENFSLINDAIIELNNNTA